MTIPLGPSILLPPLPPLRSPPPPQRPMPDPVRPTTIRPRSRARLRVRHATMSMANTIGRRRVPPSSVGRRTTSHIPIPSSRLTIVDSSPRLRPRPRCPVAVGSMVHHAQNRPRPPVIRLRAPLRIIEPAMPPRLQRLRPIAKEGPVPVRVPLARPPLRTRKSCAPPPVLGPCPRLPRPCMRRSPRQVQATHSLPFLLTLSLHVDNSRGKTSDAPNLPCLYVEHDIVKSAAHF